MHWVVTLNRRNRSLFFALGLPVLGTHLVHIGAGPLMWTLLALQLLVYPQLVYWRALRAADSLRAEKQHLLLDGVLLGAWMAVWGFPLWISFMLFVGVSLNVVIFMGMPGLWKGMAALGSGALLAGLLHGFAFRPDTLLSTSLLCIVLLTAYQLFFANDAYRRAISLRDSRYQLGEQLAKITLLQDKLEAQAQRDPLTGLYNRRFLDDALARQVPACVAASAPLALVLIDIDRFKRINDTYGHPAGDAVLQRLAQLLTAQVHARDAVICRYGGEEFLLMLPGTPVVDAATLAERLRAQFETSRVALDGRSIGSTLSIGVAGLPGEAATPQALVQEADRALYAAKLGGRNRVVLADPMHARKMG